MSYSLGNSLLAPTSSSFRVLPRDTIKINENNNQIITTSNDKIQEIWNKHTFKSEKIEQHFNFDDLKVSSWINDNISERTMKEESREEEKMPGEAEIEVEHRTESPKEDSKDQNGSPSHHARRPMNAFLIFCKKHRPIVRDRYHNLENRGVTKILGEWWSLLEEEDKTPFTNLANEYKDAFLSANPDFKWYKLPAPPLRTLAVRPTNLGAICAPKLLPTSPQTSPTCQNFPSNTANNNNNNNNYNTSVFNEFTPGKLADESQLGSLTTLLNNNFSSAALKEMCCENRKSPVHISDICENNNEPENCDKSQQSPVNLIKSAVLPPKPIKKRFYQSSTDIEGTKEVIRNILNFDNNDKNNKDIQFEQFSNIGNCIANQDANENLVDNFSGKFDKEILDLNVLDGDKTRKSGRQCKGKRYEKFMVEGRLLGNKKDSRLTQNKPSSSSSTIAMVDVRPEKNNVPEIMKNYETPNLENTIKRLAERTKAAILPKGEEEIIDSFLPKTTKQPEEEEQELTNNDNKQNEKEENETIKEEIEDKFIISNSEMSADPSSHFNLDEKIGKLPSLSYEAFVVKKKESKRRKMKKTTVENKKNADYSSNKRNETSTNQPVGSRKRKNKHSITHLGKKERKTDFNDLLGLATLAEVAANTQKINEK